MKCVSVHINPNANIEDVWKKLELLNAVILYSEEENSSKVIYAHVPNNFNMQLKNDDIIAITPYQLPEIDWKKQYESHGFNYHSGAVHVDLKIFGALNPLYNPIKIEPGSGYGDLSHPTTALTLKLMSPHLETKHVLDIGSGSGILSFGAVSMGAASVFGIDIDIAAILHAKQNSLLNHMENLILFGLPEEFILPPKIEELTILMNMIQQEQMEAWSALKMIHKLPGSCFTSGILKEDKKRYLNWTNSLGWKLLSCIENQGWLAFHFLRPPP